MGAARRALVIGVGKFSTRGEFSGFPELAFTEEMASRVAQGYARLGFSLGEPVRNPDRRTLAELLDTLGQPGEATVLHYVGHGASGRGPGAYFIAASDSLDDPDDYASTCVNLGSIINDLNNSKDGPPVLVVLDTCEAEVVSQQALEGAAGDNQRVWVIAASAKDHKAYRGRLTEAVIAVLAEVERGDFHLASDIEFVPLDMIARRIGEHVERLCDRDAQPGPGESAVPRQRVRFWQAETTTNRAPFFWNPDFAVAEQQATELLRQVAPDPELRRVLATLARDANPAHFIDAARGRQRQLRPGERLCYFTGRRSTLDRVARWLRDGDAPLCLVTGSPGVGKSAVLGVLACGLHPALRSVALDVIPSLPEEFFLPATDPYLAVVHARGKDVSQILVAIAAQLGLGEPSQGRWSTDDGEFPAH